ncbi:MAG: helix-turn-helix domain-containing protein [Anaerolineales bacterium]|nr:helix-turn-helix domain-containing protein [Anaerolineales bacterium]
MTTKQAAEILGLAPESVARLVKRGTLKGERFGHAWMIYRSSVEEYLEQTKDKAKSDPTRGKTDN